MSALWACAEHAVGVLGGLLHTLLLLLHPRYLSHHLAAISMAAVYTDAAHIADGVIGLKQRSLAANDPTE
jgi:hypothetical protein